MLGVPQQVAEGTDPVRHVRVAEQGTVQQRGQTVRVEVARQLQQLEQVDDLVVAPVPDVAPGVVRLLDLPVDARLGDAVGVVAVHGRAIDELGDHVFREPREAECQGFPVLEDVAPVALVPVQRIAIPVPQPDGELVPRPARVAMAAPDGDRQVLEAQPFELRVAAARDHGSQFVEAQGLWKGIQQRPRALVDGLVEGADRLAEVARRDLVPARERAAAQHVKHHVGIVVCSDLFLGRALEGVAGGHQAFQPVGAFRDRCVDRRGQSLAAGELPVQRHHAGLAEFHVRHDLPAQHVAGRQLDGLGDEERAPDASRVVLGPQRGAAPEGVDLLRGHQHRRRLEAVLEGDAGVQRLAGFSAIGDACVKGIDGEAGSVEQFRPLVRIHQVAGVGLREAWRAGGQEVLQAVDELHGLRRAADIAQLALPHEAEGFAGQPGVAEGKTEVVVDLLETELVARHALVEVPAEFEQPVALAVEGLPEAEAAGRRDPQQRPGAGVQAALVDLVHRDVGEQAGVRRHPPGGESPGRGDEQPVVPARDHADQERWHPVDVPDGVEALAGQVDEFTSDGQRRAALRFRCRVHDFVRACPSSSSRPNSPASIQPRSVGP